MTVPSPQVYAALEAELAAVRSALAVRDAELEEARVHQTATAEILQVISRSPTDVKPVFEAIAERAAVLCKATSASSLRFDGDLIHLVGLSGMSREGEDALRAIFPRKADRSLIVGRVVLERKAQHVPDVQADTELPYQRTAETAGIRSLLAVPMLREDEVVGVIGVTRGEPGMFPAPLVQLLQTFADQAVIAIENVRLVNETREALDQQTATAEVLKVISSSVAEAQPVFEKILDSCHALFDVENMAIALLHDDGQLHLGAGRGVVMEVASKLLPRPLEGTATARAILERRTIYTSNLSAVSESYTPFFRSITDLIGNSSGLVAPLLLDGRGIGSIWLARVPPKPFTDKEIALLTTFADQAVIAIENARMFRETQEALERQTATAEVLRVISTSMADPQPVYEKILDRCETFLDAELIGIFVEREGAVENVGFRGGQLAEKVVRTVWPIAVADSTYSTIIVERRVVNVAAVSAMTERPRTIQRTYELIGDFSFLVLPLVWENRLIGGIACNRWPPRPFSDKEAQLLAAFADQATIAIQNTQMFRETQEALERQTATAEILQVISNSPTSTQPVFEVIAERALAISGYDFCNISSYDGEFMRLEASVGMAAEDLAELLSSFEGRQGDASLRPSRGSAVGRAILSGVVVKIADHTCDPDFEHSGTRVLHRFRSLVAVPLIRNGRTIGGMTLGRTQPGDVSDKIVRLLQTFADQAVIAIQNVRLFNETQESLAWQTAISDVLRVTTESQDDVAPVLAAIAEHAVNLCNGAAASIFLKEGEQQRHMISCGALASQADSLELLPIDRRSMTGRAILEGLTIQVADMQAATEEFPVGVEYAQRLGHRSMVVAPLLREGKAFGTLLVRRQEVRPFSEREVSLLETFAAQAAIALQNVRLFRETKEALEHQTATGEILKVISSSMADTQPVFEKILDSCEQLFDAQELNIFMASNDRFHLAGWRGRWMEFAKIGFPLPIDDVLSGLPFRECRTLHIPSVGGMANIPLGARRLFEQLGDFSTAIAPMLREGRAVGTIGVIRQPPKSFTDKELTLLSTFADQAVIAIENARLFREIEDKSRQLEEASKHKSQFLASMSHELRTPLNAILGFNEMILDEIYGEVPVDMREPLKDIQDSGKHLLRLINNVLDLAKIEAGRMELALAEYSVQDILESVRATLRPLASAKGLEFATIVPDELPLAYGDFGRITQCLMNLAGNSLKFTSVGRVEISIELQGSTLVFRVADTGIGIPTDKIDSLFTEFKQTDATIASEYGGTGLGLSISRKFVEMHGGRIWVESEVGQGSAFSFEVPLRIEQAVA